VYVVLITFYIQILANRPVQHAQKENDTTQQQTRPVGNSRSGIPGNWGSLNSRSGIPGNFKNFRFVFVKKFCAKF